MTRIGGLTIRRCAGWLATGRAPITIVLFRAPLLPEWAKPDTLWEPPCCTDRGCRRTEPYPCSGLCDADVLRASQPQHSVQHADSDGYLACLSPVRLEAQSVTDDALPSRDVSLHQSAPVVARGFLPSHAAVLGNGLEMPV